MHYDRIKSINHRKTKSEFYNIEHRNKINVDRNKEYRLGGKIIK